MDRAHARLTAGPVVWLAVLPLAFLAIFFAYPVAAIVARGLSAESWEVLASARTWRIIGFTVMQAVVSTALTLIVALPAAYALNRLRIPGRRVLIAIATVPFVLPTVAVGLAFRALLPPSWIGGLPVILLAHVFFNYAVVVRVVGGLWGQLDRRYEQAAAAAGASPSRVFRTITWPLIRPAVLAATMLVFLFTVTSFGVIVVLGGPTTTTLEVEIYRRTAQQLDLAGAASLTLLQLGALVVVLLVSAGLQQRLAVAQRLTSEPRPEPIDTGVRRAAAAWTLVTIAVLLVAPMGALVVRSFRVAGGWGLDWWTRMGSIDAGTTRAVAPVESLLLSLQTAAVATVLSVIIGGAAALAIASARRAGRIIDAGLMIPLGTSAVTVGFGLLIAFSRGALDLRGAWLLIPIAHSLIAIPLVVRAVLPVARSIDPRVTEVARTLGASRGRAWWDVERPVLMRALGVAAGFAFAVSLGEFGATAFLARSDAPTVPVQIVRLLGRPGEQSLGIAMALSTMLIVVTATVMLLTERLRAGKPGEL